MKKYIYPILFVFYFSFFGCQSDSTTSNTGFRNIELSESFESVSQKIKTLQKSPGHISKSRGKDLTEYYSFDEPSFKANGINVSPSFFYVFNDKNELTEMRLWYLCEIAKTKLDLDKTMAELDKKEIKGIAALAKTKTGSETKGNQSKSVKIDISSEYPIIKYEVKLK